MIHRPLEPARHRVGAISFLNTVPLIEGLQAQREVALTHDLPARLADALFDERIDVGLIPIVEYLRGVGGQIVPGICIASHGAAQTVKVFSKVPLEQAEAVAVDRASRTSVALLRVLLAELYDRHPDLHVAEPLAGQLFAHYDTALVIGDRVWQMPEQGLHVYDLGVLWRDLTGLPFVYAAWVLSSELDAPEAAARRGALVAHLKQAKADGFARLPQLAAREAVARGLDRGWVESYWTDALRYDLGEAELAGLARFAELCTAHNLCAGRGALELAQA
jgi:chorismate dehydratase